MRRAPVANAGQSELITSSLGRSGNRKKARATPSKATLPRHRHGPLTCGYSQIDRHTVMSGLDLSTQALRHVGCDLLGIGSPHSHPIVGEEREARFGLADDPLRV